MNAIEWRMGLSIAPRGEAARRRSVTVAGSRSRKVACRRACLLLWWTPEIARTVVRANPETSAGYLQRGLPYRHRGDHRAQALRMRRADFQVAGKEKNGPPSSAVLVRPVEDDLSLSPSRQVDEGRSRMTQQTRRQPAEDAGRSEQQAGERPGWPCTKERWRPPSIECR